MGSPRVLCRVVLLFIALLLPFAGEAQSTATWNGVVRDAAGKAVASATVRLRARGGFSAEYQATSAADGTFLLADIVPATYEILVKANGLEWKTAAFEVK